MIEWLRSNYINLSITVIGFPEPKFIAKPFSLLLFIIVFPIRTYPFTTSSMYK